MSREKTVLVVEDEPIIRGLVSLVLESEGYIVQSAPDGREALDSIQCARPDAVVIDLDLPIMDGFELVRACRAEDGTRYVPIIVVSAIYRGERVEALDAHAFLSKPFDVERLVAQLHDVLR